MIFHDFSTISTCWCKKHGFRPKCRNGVLWPKGKIRNLSILEIGQNQFGGIWDTSKASRRNFFKFQNFEKMMVLVIFSIFGRCDSYVCFLGYQNFDGKNSTEKGNFIRKILSMRNQSFIDSFNPRNNATWIFMIFRWFGSLVSISWVFAIFGATTQNTGKSQKTMI